MRGIDLRTFDFDWDLTWAGYLMNANGRIYGRFGGRDAGDPERYLTLTGLKHALRAALQAYRANPDAPPEAVTVPFSTPEQYPAARELKADACIHCHQVGEFKRDYLRRQGLWRKAMAYQYPPPESLGVSVDPAEGARIVKVSPDSAGSRAGLRPGDILRRLNGRTVASYGDLLYALHHAPETGEIAVEWEREGRAGRASLELKPGWRVSDISWRASMWGLEPTASVYGEDLGADERAKHGLSKTRLAFRMGDYVPRPAREAGIRAGDIILGIEGGPTELNMLQFNLWVRMNREVGDVITYLVIRDGSRLRIPMKLQARDTF